MCRPIWWILHKKSVNIGPNKLQYDPPKKSRNMGQIGSQMLAVDHFWQSVDVILEDVPVIETIFDAKLSI